MSIEKVLVVVAGFMVAKLVDSASGTKAKRDREEEERYEEKELERGRKIAERNNKI
jgi:hypothetical protein